ncbi:MAG: hypothetical protein AAF577_13125 [Pseudomonadota bacterium]
MITLPIIAVDADQAADPATLSQAGLDAVFRDADAYEIGIFSERAVRHYHGAASGLIRRALASSPGCAAADLDVMHDALFRFFQCELATLLPLRALCRGALPTALSSVSIVQNDADELHYGRLWERNELELLALAIGLHRRGQKISLALPPAVIQRGFLRLRPSTLIRRTRPKGVALFARARRRVVSPHLVRNHLGYRDLAPSLELSHARTRTRLVDAINLDVAGHHLPVFDLPIEDRTEGGGHVLRLDPAALFRRFIDAYAHRLQAKLAKAAAQVQRFDVREFHAADVLLEDNAVFAAAVHRAGGRVVLWPHSLNAAHLDVRRCSAEKAIVPTTTVAAQWRTRFPQIETVVDSAVSLPFFDRAAQVDASAPVHLVIFGGAQTLGRFPLIDLDDYVATQRRFLASLLQFGASVKVIYKPKGRWEKSFSYARDVDPDGRVEIIDTPATQIERPNLVFCSVGTGTSALIEGMARAIPGVIVREHPVWDYTELTPEILPIGPPEEIAATVAALRDPKAYRALIGQQRAWFERVTRRSDTA